MNNSEEKTINLISQELALKLIMLIIFVVHTKYINALLSSLKILTSPLLVWALQVPS